MAMTQQREFQYRKRNYLKYKKIIDLESTITQTLKLTP